MHLTIPWWPVTKAADTGRVHQLHTGEYWQLFFLLIKPLVALSLTDLRLHGQLCPKYSDNRNSCLHSMVIKNLLSIDTYQTIKILNDYHVCVRLQGQREQMEDDAISDMQEDVAKEVQARRKQLQVLALSLCIAMHLYNALPLSKFLSLCIAVPYVYVGIWDRPNGNLLGFSGCSAGRHAQ